MSNNNLQTNFDFSKTYRTRNGDAVESLHLRDGRIYGLIIDTKSGAAEQEDWRIDGRWRDDRESIFDLIEITPENNTSSDGSGTEEIEVLRKRIETDLAELFRLTKQTAPAMTHLTPYCISGNVSLWGCNGGTIAEASTLHSTFAGMLDELNKLTADLPVVKAIDSATEAQAK